MKRNKLLSKLRQGEVVIIPEVGHFASYKLLEMMGLIGFDGVWIDMEHKDLGLETLGTLTLACRATGMEPVVRVAKGGYVDLIRPLETGATGIVIPHCMSEKEAREIVRDTRFSPVGRRGFDGVGPDARYRTVPIEEYRKWANEEVLVVVMIEDREAVEDVDAIASVPGIDAFYLGPADLSQSYGHFLDFDHALMRKAIDKIASAAAKNKKWWGGPVINTERFREMRTKGASFFTCGGDVFVLRDAYCKIKEEIDSLCKAAPG